MSFQEELEEILAKTPCIDSDCGGQGGTWQGDPENPEPVQCQYCYQERYPFIEEALTSIINLVDKELPEKKPNALKPGGVLSEDGKTVAISNLQSASSGGYNQAIDDMRAKLKGVSNGNI